MNFAHLAALGADVLLKLQDGIKQFQNGIDINLTVSHADMGDFKVSGVIKAAKGDRPAAESK